MSSINLVTLILLIGIVLLCAGAIVMGVPSSRVAMGVVMIVVAICCCISTYYVQVGLIAAAVASPVPLDVPLTL
jgi:hypothetical protein